MSAIRKIDRKGNIQYEGTLYGAYPGLAGQRVQVAHNPNDVRGSWCSIVVCDPDSGEEIGILSAYETRDF